MAKANRLSCVMHDSRSDPQLATLSLRFVAKSSGAMQGANSVGLANATPEAGAGTLCCHEGSWLMNAAGMVPGVNTMAGFHDFLTDPNPWV